MRLLYLMLLLSSLVLPEDEPPVGAGGGGEGAEAGVGLPQALPEGPKRLQLCEAAFCWQCTFLWMAQTPWGFHLVGAAALLLWLAVNVWSMSCLAAPPKQAPGRKAVSLVKRRCRPHPRPAALVLPEADLGLPACPRGPDPPLGSSCPGVVLVGENLAWGVLEEASVTGCSRPSWAVQPPGVGRGLRRCHRASVCTGLP